MSRKILERFRYPNETIQKVAHIIKEHMFNYEEIWTDAAVRRFVIRVGEAHLSDLYSLRRADAYGTSGIPLPRSFLAPLAGRVKEVLAKDRTFSLKDLRIDGTDLRGIGVKPGPCMGIILNELLETVVEDPSINTKEKLLEIAGHLNRRYT
jgi:hypothetical protein